MSQKIIHYCQYIYASENHIQIKLIQNNSLKSTEYKIDLFQRYHKKNFNQTFLKINRRLRCKSLTLHVTAINELFIRLNKKNAII